MLAPYVFTAFANVFSGIYLSKSGPNMFIRRIEYETPSGYPPLSLIITVMTPHPTAYIICERLPIGYVV